MCTLTDCTIVTTALCRLSESSSWVFSWFLSFSGCLDLNRAGCVLRLQPLFLQQSSDIWQSSSFLSANQPLADWRASVCNNIPASRRQRWRYWCWCGGEKGVQLSLHPSKSALINTAWFILLHIKSDKWLLAFRRRGPSAARGSTAISPPLASWRSCCKITVFFFS